MIIKFHKILNRIGLMAWHRKFFYSSMQGAKTFVDSNPKEIKLNCYEPEYHPEWTKEFVEDSLSGIVEYTVERDFELLHYLKSLNKDYKDELIKQGIFKIQRESPRHPSDFRNMINPIRKNLDYNSFGKRALFYDFDFNKNSK